MSAVWLHVGQCGNQIGQEWWRIITEGAGHSIEADRYPFLSRDGKLGAICVDSEPKVLRKAQKLVKHGSFRESNLIVGQEGRGSNWAYGYYGPPSEGERGLLQRTMESFRKETERKDCYSGTVLFHSLSGGTGAGLGARLCEEIREAYPLGHILSVSVAPHQAGESPLQHYNNLLCLAALQRSTDGVLLFHNDEALSRVLSLQSRIPSSLSGPQAQVSLSSMNSHIASCLAGLLHPVHNLTTPRSTVLWDSLAASTLQMLPRHSPSGKPHYSSAVLAVARGGQSKSFLSSLDPVLRRLRHGHHCAAWNPFPIDYWTDPQDVVSPSPSSCSLTVCSNHSSVTDLLQRVGERAHDMFQARAYLHWYHRYGCEDQDFLQAFDALRTVTEEYRAGEE
ncbi:tubulin beta chain-like isoform X3 [Polyodon spathula]|uniref:tubulin beta chain-like isoform X3 n=1 Tax=Polyodon spathula TaxID=7913 RepID=UPI001B7EF0F0|nr:tubulin beta chain-like isoform X3 [Polyodon spathula]